MTRTYLYSNHCRSQFYVYYIYTILRLFEKKKYYEKRCEILQQPLSFLPADGQHFRFQSAVPCDPHHLFLSCLAPTLYVYLPLVLERPTHIDGRLPLDDSIPMIREVYIYIYIYTRVYTRWQIRMPGTSRSSSTILNFMDARSGKRRGERAKSHVSREDGDFPVWLFRKFKGVEEKFSDVRMCT